MLHLSYAAPFHRQIILVTALHKYSIHGHLALWNYDHHRWHCLLTSPVILGAMGLTKNKHEGDDKSPIGVFSIHNAFGFAKKPNYLHMSYKKINMQTICVDDPHSHYYNRIINADHASHPDWHSAEPMAQIPDYRLGLVVNYNPSHRTGRGSCIFIHNWQGLANGTAGCTTLPPRMMQRLMHLIDNRRHPLLIQTINDMFFYVIPTGVSAANAAEGSNS